MTQHKPVRVGIMGFGQTGRQIFELASRSDDVEVVAVADIGKPDILHYLLCSEVDDPKRHRLEGNFLANDRFRAIDGRRIEEIHTGIERRADNAHSIGFGFAAPETEAAVATTSKPSH